MCTLLVFICNEPDMVQQRIFVHLFKRGSVIIFSNGKTLKPA